MAATLAVWTSMLCHAAANEGDAWGTLAGWDDLDCAINLGIDRAIVFAIRNEMEGRTLDGVRVLAWENRQQASDNGAARMRKWREKKREENQSSSVEVTSLSRHGDATVTAKKRREEKKEEEDTPHTPRKRGAAPLAPRVDLPDWLPPDAWAEWCAHRRGQKWTQRAVELSIAHLAEMRAAGHDPERVIRQSIANGWRGLFPLKGSGVGAQRDGTLTWILDINQREKTA